MALFFKPDIPRTMSTTSQTPPTRRSFFNFNLGHLISLVVFLVTAAVVWGNVSRTIEQQTSDLIMYRQQMDKSDDTVRKMAEDIAIIKNDLGWIKHKLDSK